MSVCAISSLHHYMILQSCSMCFVSTCVVLQDLMVCNPPSPPFVTLTCAASKDKCQMQRPCQTPDIACLLMIGNPSASLHVGSCCSCRRRVCFLRLALMLMPPNCALTMQLIRSEGENANAPMGSLCVAAGTWAANNCMRKSDAPCHARSCRAGDSCKEEMSLPRCAFQGFQPCSRPAGFEQPGPDLLHEQRPAGQPPTSAFEYHTLGDEPQQLKQAKCAEPSVSKAES